MSTTKTTEEQQNHIRNFLKRLKVSDKDPILTERLKVCYLETTTDKLNMFKIHPLNRRVNKEHVKKMITECQVIIAQDKFIKLIVCIDTNEIINSDNLDELKFIILDGQHRFTALHSAIKRTSQKGHLMVECHLVNGDDEILAIIDDLNKGLPLTEKDKIEAEIKKDFRKIFSDIVGVSNLRRRCVQYVLNSNNIKESKFVDSLVGKTEKEIKDVIFTIAELYHAQYDEQKVISPTVNRLIIDTGLYQLIEEKTPDWIKLIPDYLTCKHKRSNEENNLINKKHKM
jgi:hypothetical protein